jgi:hypothetical protein
MKRSVRILLSASIALAAAGLFVGLSPQGNDEVAQPPSGTIAAGSGMLDGKVFEARLGMEGRPADRDDTLVFDRGVLLSLECQKICDFPARPYYVRQTEDHLEFVSITRCPTRDAEIVWRGKVRDGAIEGVASWTTKRWYWTVERDFHFSGTLSSGTPATLAMD